MIVTLKAHLGISTGQRKTRESLSVAHRLAAVIPAKPRHSHEQAPLDPFLWREGIGGGKKVEE
jgi:hypothetical protein